MEKLTSNIPQPVGMKASMQRRMSLGVKRRRAMKVMRIARNVRNTRPLMILKSSWKFVLNRLLPIPKPCDRFAFDLVTIRFSLNRLYIK